MVFDVLKEFFEKFDFEKKQQTTKKACKITQQTWTDEGGFYMRSLINELRLLTLGRQIFMIKMMIWVFNDANNLWRLIEGLTE